MGTITESYTNGILVQTPIGIGTVMMMIPYSNSELPELRYVVILRRDDYTAEQWQEINSRDGLIVYRTYAHSCLTPVLLPGEVEE